MDTELKHGYFEYFREKIKNEFNQDVRKIENYQPDISPLVYCSLKNNRIVSKKRIVIESNYLSQSDWRTDESWISLKRKIELGEDINYYMSKKINNWDNIDYLLLTCNITHIHLKKNKFGGSGNDLVFGIFTDNEFYAICIDNHKNLYDTEKFLTIANESWENLELFRYKQTTEIEQKNINPKDFKLYANNSNLQFNMLNLPSILGVNGEYKTLDGHQNDILTKFTINNIKYHKIPMKIWLAYNNEIEYLINLDANLFEKHGSRNISLRIDRKRKNYLITINLKKQIEKKYKIPKNIITCTNYINDI